MTGTDAVSARQLAAEMGLRQQTLSRWLQEASSLPLMAAKRSRRDWSIEEKIRILATARSLTGAELTALLQRAGVRHAGYSIGDNAAATALLGHPHLCLAKRRAV